MQGFIRDRDVLMHPVLITQGFGVRAYLRAVGLLLTGSETTTFLQCIGDHSKKPQARRRGARGIVALVAIGLALVAPDAEAKLSRTADAPAVSFNASGPGGLAIVGTTSQLSLVDDGQLIKVFVPLNTLTTGISLRDKHMREKYLEVEKFPNAELQVPRSAIAFPAVGQGSTADIKGTIAIHGVTKPVTLHYAAKNVGGTFEVTGTIPVNMKDFGINVPSYLGVTVKPDITVEVHFRAVDA